MMDIADFLSARLDEDERVARAAVIPAHDRPGAVHPHPELAEWAYRQHGEVEYVTERHLITAAGGRFVESDPFYVTCDSEGILPAVDDVVGPHIARHDPARVLREVDSKRRLLMRYRAGVEGGSVGWVLACLAGAYSDHPDYNQGWSVQ